MTLQEKRLAPRNRTILLTDDERKLYKQRLLKLSEPATINDVSDKMIWQDTFQALRYLPEHSIDLLFADPPYNLSKTFNEQKFQRTSLDEYEEWLDSWLSLTIRLLKPAASIYICG